MANRFINPVPQFFTNDGVVQSGGGLAFYLTGTSTPAETYQNATLTIPTANPVPFDSAGRPTQEIFLNPNITYKVVWLSDYTDLGSVLRTRDPVVDPAANVTAAIQVYPGNPNGNLAGNQGTPGGSGASMVWDTTNNLLYICTTTGDAATAVWTSTTASLSGAVLLTGVISPAVLSANQDNYNPAGGGAASEWRLDLSADVDITGIAGGVAGRILVTSNVSASNYVRFLGEVSSTASTAANRLDIQGIIALGPRQTAFWKYDGVASRWKLLAMTGSWARTVLTDAATITWDLSTGKDFEVTITDNRTLGAFTRGTVGQEGMLVVREDATGGRSLGMSNAVYDFPGNFPQPNARGANEETFYKYKVITPNTAMQIRRIGATSIGEGPRDLLNAVVASASATIDFVLTKWLNLYDRFEIDFDDFLASTDGVALNFRTSTNAGSSYDSGGTDYLYTWARLSSVSDAFASTGASLINLIGLDAGLGMSNVAGETAAGRVTVYSPRAVAPCKVSYESTHVGQSYQIVNLRGMGVRNTAADVDAVRIFPSSGTIASGTARLYGVRV